MPNWSSALRFFALALVRPRRVQTSHQLWKAAVFAESIRVIAEIADDLEQTLLHGCGPQGAGTGAAEQTSPRQAQHGVILRF